MWPTCSGPFGVGAVAVMIVGPDELTSGFICGIPRQPVQAQHDKRVVG